MLDVKQIKNVSAKNFRSLLDISLDLPEGLIILHGKNGSGKTSLIYAIQYTLFGKVPRLTKSEITSELTGETPTTAITFDNGLRIKRAKNLSIRHNKKSLDVREREKLTKLFSSLRYSFLTSDATLFADALPSERRRLLSTIIDDLGILQEGVVKQLKNYTQRVSTRRANLELQLANITGKITATESNVKKLAYDAEEAKRAVIRMKEELFQVREELLSLEEEKKRFEETYDLKGAEETLARLKNKLSEVRANILKVNDELDELRAKVRLAGKLAQELSMLEEEISNAQRSIQEKVCSWCGSKLRVKQIARMAEKVEAKKTRAAKIREQIEEIRKGEAKHHELQEGLKTLHRQEKELLQEIDKVQRDLDAYKDILLRIKSKKERVKILEDAIAKTKEKLDNTQLKELRKELKELKKEAARIEKAVKVLSSREGMFGNLTTFVRKPLFDAYVAYLCNYLQKITNTLLDGLGFQVDLVVDEGVVDIQVNGSSFRSRSSGERQRIRLALATSFAALATKSDFIVVDEVFDANLDREGIEFVALRLIPWLCSRFGQVIIVSHREELLTILNPVKVFYFERVNGATQIASL